MAAGLGSTLGCVARKHPFHVLCQDVELDVHRIANLDLVDVGVAFRMRNDPNCEAFRQKLCDGQTDAIDGDGAFVSRIMSEVGRQFDLNPIIFAGAVQRNDLCAAIDVTLDKVAAKRRAGCKRAFEVYLTITSKLFEIGAVERFLEQIERELVAAMRADGQTTTVHGDAVADSNRGRELWRGHLQLSAAIGRPTPPHPTYLFDQSGEHVLTFSAGTI